MKEKFDTIEKMQESLQQILSKKRYRHTLGVRYTAQVMAMRFGEDLEKAGIAGVLHDCAKYLSDAQMLSECQKYDIECSDVEIGQPSLLHAKLGACYAKEIYGVRDTDILSAIRWHTTGKPEMTMLEKIVFIADYIEPGRKPVPHMDEIRRMSLENTDRAMYLILKNTIEYLQEAGQEQIDMHSQEAFRHYKKKVSKRLF